MPPCTEDVIWVVMKTPMPMADDQLAVFERLYPRNTRRSSRPMVAWCSSRADPGTSARLGSPPGARPRPACGLRSGPAGLVHRHRPCLTGAASPHRGAATAPEMMRFLP
ncbi:carbonic anhydrase family protein [Thauera humireducens]|uniref:carbonic anhydrase family protein n=1 Tax=Thauera humireducens TaxID=1134435 RepID=UPI00311D3760